MLTRLPGDLQVTPGEAAELMGVRFGHVELATRDGRARGIYEVVGTRVLVAR